MFGHISLALGHMISIYSFLPHHNPDPDMGLGLCFFAFSPDFMAFPERNRMLKGRCNESVARVDDAEKLQNTM